MPVLYTSEAKLFVRLGRETVALDPTATTGQTVTLQETRENEINSIFEILKSRALAEQLVDTFGANAILGKLAPPVAEAQREQPENPEPVAAEFSAPLSIWKQLNPLTTYSVRDKAIRKLSERLRVDPVRKSNIINVWCDATDPALAQKLAAKAIELAKSTHMRVNRTIGSFAFFDAQSDEQARRLASLEDHWRELKNRTGIADVDEERTILQRRVATLADERLKIAADLAAARGEAIARQDTLLKIPATQVTSETIGQPQTAASRMREQLYALELKEKELSSRFQPDTVFVQQVREQIADARALLAAEVEPVQTTKSLNQAHQQTEVALMEGDARVASLEAQLNVVQEQLAGARTALVAFNDAELELTQLQRGIELEKTSFTKNAESRELARIDQALQETSISNLNILQEPSYSVTPTRPRVLVNFAFGFVLALIASCGVAGLAELRIRRPASEDPLARTTWNGESFQETLPAGRVDSNHGNGHATVHVSPAERGSPHIPR